MMDTYSGSRAKRAIEMIGMLAVSGALVVLSKLETNLFELSEQLSAHQEIFNTVIYFGLININVVLILVLSFLIFRNVVKLILERRQGVIGSKLRTKLVVSLVFFAVAPTALMFYVSSRFIADSFETWFSSRVEDTMAKTREAGSRVYEREGRRLESLSRIALQKIDAKGVRFDFFNGHLVPVLDANSLHSFTHEYRVDALKVFDLTGRLIWPLYLNQVLSSEEHEFIRSKIQVFLDQPGLTSLSAIRVEEDRDVVKGIAPIYAGNLGEMLGVVITEEKFDTQIKKSIDVIIQEFANLKPGAQLIRLSFTILLVVMVLLILFSATWLGFYVAKAILGPIQALAEATKEVAHGNYTVILQGDRRDETGQLIQSFNRMTEDLRRNQAQVKRFTEQLKATNLELESRRKYMEVVLQNIASGVISLDANGYITSMNDAAHKLLGITGQDYIGRHIEHRLQPEVYRDFWLPIATALKSTNTFSDQVQIGSGLDGVSFFVDCSKTFDENSIFLGFVIVFTDASEQIKAQKVAAWREVARRIAHEIKNPITPIKLTAQRLLRKFSRQFHDEDRKVFESCIGTIISEVDSLRDLVNEFSRFARLPALKLSQHKINDVIREVCGLYSMSYPGIDFRLDHLADDLPLVMIDREQMARVINNLIGNAEAAIRMIGSPGVIEIRSKFVVAAQAIRIEVRDNGAGIPDVIKSRVLEPYFSTKQEGTGLGLSIVQQVVSDHGGYLRIGDNVPQGTIIIIELPALGARNEP